MSSQESSVNVPKWVNRLQAVATAANQDCQFSQRNRQIDAASFVSILVWGWVSSPNASLNQLAEFATHLGKHITAQACDERIKSAAVVLLMHVLQRLLQQQTCPASLPSQRLRQFSGIYLTDSTQFSLPDRLHALFVGQGTSAQVKVQLCLEYLSGTLSALALESGRTPDQTCRLPVQFGHAGSLHLFDLGYFDQDHLDALNHQQAFYVTRLQSQVALYAPQTTERVELAAYLRHTPVASIDLTLQVGARVHTPARVIGYRLPPDQAAARRRQAKRKAREDGKTCSAAHLDLQDWNLYLTNLPATWTPEDIAALYRLRWQIELVFRAWKSQLKLAHLGNWRLHRILCQLYAHLIGCVLVHALLGPWRYQLAQEYSPVKLLQILQDYLPRFWRDPPDIFTANLEDAFRRFARKDKRKKAPSSLSAFMD